MRFLSSKISLIVITFLLITALVWISVGNFQGLASIAIEQSDGKPQTVFLDNLKEFFSGLIKWIYTTSKPIASELSASLQSWWETQKVIIVDHLIKWLSQQQNDISTILQSRLHGLTSNAMG